MNGRMIKIKESGQIRKFNEMQIVQMLKHKLIRLCQDCQSYHATSLAWTKIDRMEAYLKMVKGK